MLHDHSLDEPLGKAIFNGHDELLTMRANRHADKPSKTNETTGYSPPRIIGFVSDAVDSGTGVPELENMWDSVHPSAASRAICALFLLGM